MRRLFVIAYISEYVMEAIGNREAKVIANIWYSGLQCNEDKLIIQEPCVVTFTVSEHLLYEFECKEKINADPNNDGYYDAYVRDEDLNLVIKNLWREKLPWFFQSYKTLDNAVSIFS